MFKKKSLIWWLNGLKWVSALVVIYVAVRHMKGFFSEEDILAYQIKIWDIRWYYILPVIMLCPVNWMLEALRWLLLTTNFDKRRMSRLIKEILTGISLSIVTPQRLGEYVGRLLYFEPDKQISAVKAQFRGALAQWVVTLCAGIAGWMYLKPVVSSIGLSAEGSSVFYAVLWVVIMLLILLIYFRLESVLSFFSRVFIRFTFINRIRKYTSVTYYKQPNLTAVLIVSFARYLVYTLQFYLLLYYFNGPLDFWYGISAISIIYLIQSGVPLPSFFSLVIRSEIAIMLLWSQIDNKTGILSASYCLWIINLGIPAIIGLWPLLRLNIKKTLGHVSK
jgi:hypothetical protein